MTRWKRLPFALLTATAVVSSPLDSAITAHAVGSLAAVATATTDKKRGISGFGSGTEWVNLCERLAPYSTVLCVMAPIPTIRQISRDKSTGNLPLLPYSSMIANGFVWAIYGILRGLPAVTASNCVGVALGFFYFYEFLQYADPAARHLPGTASHHRLFVQLFVLLNLFLVTNFPRRVSTEIVGKEGVLMYIILFASPLSALKNVIATKSAASIPLPFTVACIINCFLWLTVGLLKLDDFNIYFPSILGLVCALVQLFTKVIYGNGFIHDGFIDNKLEMGKDFTSMSLE